MRNCCPIAVAVALAAPGMAAASTAVAAPQTASTPLVIIGLVMIALGFCKRSRS